MWNPFKKEETELTAKQEREQRISFVDIQLRQTQTMFRMFIDSLEGVMTDIEDNKSACEAQMSYLQEEFEAEKEIKSRLEKREKEAKRVLGNVRKNFTIDLDDVDDTDNSSESEEESAES